MVADQYGIVGLLAFIRAIETDPNLVTLAHGIDLTTLGLNLTSQEWVMLLHKLFVALFNFIVMFL